MLKRNIELKHIGKSADDLRFFILADGTHAGGITVHSVRFPSFSYGIAVSRHMRGQGVAKAALPLMYARMRAQGFTQAVVRIAPDNAASLALHASLGFDIIRQEADAITLSLNLESSFFCNEKSAPCMLTLPNHMTK